MSDSQGALTKTHEGAAASPVRPFLLLLLRKLGAWLIDTGRFVLFLASTAGAILVQCFRPVTWRRTIWTEFMRQCHRIGVRSLPFTLLVGVLVGLGVVYHSLYWLERFGQSDVIGSFLMLVLGREIAPVVVGLIVLGRSGSRMLVDFGQGVQTGKAHMLDAQGLDPLVFLVLPRVVAAGLCTLCLYIGFVAAALIAGFVFGNALDKTQLALIDFIDLLLEATGPRAFATILLKGFCIGFAVALIACLTGFEAGGAQQTASGLLPKGFARSVVTILLISAGFSILL